MAWLVLAVAGLMETVWALLLKKSDGLSRPLPAVGFVVAAVISMVLLSQALKSLPVGPAYAVWTEIGAACTAIAGMLWLGESHDLLKLVSLVLLIAGIAGLQVASTSH